MKLRICKSLSLGLCLVASGCAGITGSGEKSQSPLANTAIKRSALSPEETVEISLEAANQLASQGHQVESIRLYQRAVQLDPKQADALAHRLAVLYDQAGDSQTALQYYERAIALEPDNADALSDRGYCRLSRGEYQLAEADFRRVLSANPNHQRARVNLGIALAWQSRYDESFQEFARIVGPAGAHSNLGVIMAKQGNEQLARRAFTQALSIDASLSQPQAFLAYFDGPQETNGVRQAQAVLPR